MGAARQGRPTLEGSQHKLATVLAAAREEFSRRGYRAVTMRGVAEKAQVSTRTLYNRYADKLSLFTACLDVGAAAFPRIDPGDERRPADALLRYSIALVEMLSTDSSMRMSMLVYREGGGAPELFRAAESNQDRYLVQPLATYLRAVGLAGDDAEARAKLFIAMALSEWQRAMTFGHALPGRTKTEHHAALVVQLFLEGAARTTDGA